MAFTRQMIRNAAKESGVEIPKELEDKLVEEHISARDTYAENQVKAAMEENKPADPVPVKDTDEYKALEKEYQDYKTEIEKDAKDRKNKSAVREYLKESVGIPEKYLDSVLRIYDMNGVEFDGAGKVKDEENKRADADKKAWADFIPTQTIQGQHTPTPPITQSIGEVTKEQFAKMSYKQRTKLFEENHDLYQKLTE